MTNQQFVAILKDLASNQPTIYCNKYPKNLGYWDGSKFSFDCWNLIKAIINGWQPNKTVGYYQKDLSITGDVDGATLLRRCTVKSKDFSQISVPGTYLYLPGHAGTYIGDTIINGQTVNVVECTGAWEKKVLYSYVDSKGGRYKFKGSSSRASTWTDWGLLPYIQYTDQPAPQPQPIPQPTPTTHKIGDQVKLKDGAKYWNGKTIPAWVFKSTLYYRGTNKNGVIFSTQKIGAITGVTTESNIIWL